MKALLPPPAAERLPFPDIGHAFRGSFLDQCGIVERWACDILASSSGEQKMPRLFGQKLEAVRELAESDLAPGAQPCLSHPKRVLHLLDRFKPIAGLRSTLAHSVQTVALRSDGEPLVVYEPVDCDRTPAIALSERCRTSLLRQAAELAKEFTDQRLKAKS